ncbi:MAG: type II secretion system F family protein [Chloroflexi bacterium]|nr:type II secretion system F family protein [Chloroflexota bacterium]
MPTEIVIIALSLAYGIFLVFAGLAVTTRRDRVQARLENYGRRVRSLDEVDLDQPLYERVIRPGLRNLARLLLRLMPQVNLDAIRLKLDMAGNPFRWAPADFLGMRVVLAALFGGFGLLLFGVLNLPLANQILVFLAVVGLGFYAPVLWLNSRIRARQHLIRRALPDAIDLITVSVEAGLGLEAAMARVARERDDEMARGLAQMLVEVQIGKTRSEAMRDMAARAGLPELSSFVAAILQAEQLGVNIAKVLRVQSDMMRIQRRQRAEEEAQRAPVKMSVVLVLMLLPALGLVILGPSVPRICKQFYPNMSICAGG